MRSIACPSVEDLRRALAGSASGPDVNSVAEHLESCPECVRAAAELDTAAGLTAELRAATADTTMPRADQLIRQLKQLWDSQAAAEDPGEQLATDLLTPGEGDELGRIGHYRILRHLGSGGMGVVFAAEDTRLHRPVAVKILSRPGVFRADLMHRERTLLAAMRHPHIVAVYDTGELNDGRPYIVMELVEGEALDQLATRCPLAVRRVVELLRDVARAVGAAHRLGIVHRDLKPQNIKVTPSGDVRVLDFGLAKRVSADLRPVLASTPSARATGVFGTRGYMSPEQARGEQVDARADVFALGIMLDQLLPPRRPRDLAAIVAKATAEAPDTRYPDAAVFADDLDRWLDGRPVAARPGQIYRAIRLVRRHRLAVSAVVLAVAGIVAGVVADNVRVRRERDQTESERRLAEVRRVEAVKNYRRARAAVQEYLTEITSDPELMSEGRYELRARLLEKARVFYEEFATEAGSDPELRADHADALVRLATIAATLGDKATARTHFLHAHTLYEALHRGEPERLDWRFAVADVRLELGSVEVSLGQPEAGDRWTQAALDLLDGIAGLDSARRRGHGYANLGWTCQTSSRKPEGVKHYERALMEYRAVVAATGLPEDRSMLGTILIRIGTSLLMMGERGPAKAYLEEVMALRQELVREFPRVPKYRYGLASCHQRCAMIAFTELRFEEAERQQKLGLEIYDALVRDYPTVTAYRFYSAQARKLYGTALRTVKRFAEAEIVLRQALADLQLLNDSFPMVFRWGANRGQVETELGLLLRDLGRTAEAHEMLSTAAERLEQHDAIRPRYSGVRSALSRSWTALAKLREELGDSAGAAAARARLDAVRARVIASKGLPPPPPDPDDDPDG